MFQDHFRLTVAENKGITARLVGRTPKYAIACHPVCLSFCMPVILIYGYYWNAAPLAERGLLNDTRLLAQIKAYHNYVIRDAVA